MSLENVKKLLEELKANEKAKELLAAAENPADGEGMAKLVAQVARQVGMPLEEKDILDALREMEREHQARTEAAADQIVKLSDSEMECAAGGAYDIHGNEIKCKYDFYDQDCFMQDACSIASQHYYGCARVYHDFCSSWWICDKNEVKER